MFYLCYHVTIFVGSTIIQNIMLPLVTSCSSILSHVIWVDPDTERKKSNSASIWTRVTWCREEYATYSTVVITSNLLMMLFFFQGHATISAIPLPSPTLGTPWVIPTWGNPSTTPHPTWVAQAIPRATRVGNIRWAFNPILIQWDILILWEWGVPHPATINRYWILNVRCIEFHFIFPNAPFFS